MKVALIDSCGVVHTVQANIKKRVGFSLRGHLYLTLQGFYGKEFTIEEWNKAQGCIVAATGDERKQFTQWEKLGADYVSEWWREQA